MPPSWLLLVAFVSLACGLVGGYGGYRLARLELRLQLRDLGRRLDAHDDDLEGLTRRVARREGQAGAERRRQVDDELAAAALAAAAKLPGAPVAPDANGATPAGNPDRLQLLQRAPWRRGEA